MRTGRNFSAIITPLHLLKNPRCRGCHGDAGLTSHFLLFQELKR